MAYKDFDSAKDEILQNRPRFTMGEREWVCRPRLSTRDLMKLSDLADASDDNDPLSVVKGFFNMVLVRKDRLDFITMLDSEEDDDDYVAVGIEQLKSAMEWLVEQYTGKASAPSKPSSDSPEPIGQPLRVVSLDPVSRSQAN